MNIYDIFENFLLLKRSNGREKYGKMEKGGVMKSQKIIPSPIDLSVALPAGDVDSSSQLIGPFCWTHPRYSAGPIHGSICWFGVVVVLGLGEQSTVALV